MNKPKCLDLYSGAGGCARGYQQAGFYVVGVDIKPQPRYVGEKFYQADALEFLSRLIETGQIEEYDLITASPPCQKFSRMTNGRWKDREHFDLIAPTRILLQETGKPYVIENVPGAPLINPIMLCGTMFDLKTAQGNQLHRHRLFEVYPALSCWLTTPCQHNKYSTVGVYGGGQNPKRKKLPAIGVYGHSGGLSKRDGIEFFGVDARREAMGIDWMTGDELNQAIPPAFTRWIGERTLEMIRVEAL